jgi:hypothetical protein
VEDRTVGPATSKDEKTTPVAAPEADVAPPPEPERRDPAPPPAPPEPDGGRDLGAILDDALDRMDRRASGEERPIPLPWSNVAAALGGGFWAGTLVTLVGDTGSGKTQWALQTGLHAAENGVPVLYVCSEAAVDQLPARLLAIKSGHKWSDLFVGRSDRDTLGTLRMGYAQAMKALPFHVVSGVYTRDSPPDVKRIVEGARRRYPQDAAGARPIMVILDFVQLAGSASRDDVREMMGRTAGDARQSARDAFAVVLLVSTTSRETRTDDTIGIHRERRQPSRLGRGNPARLVLGGREDGEVERESDTILVLAQEPAARQVRSWTRVWCAVARNRSGARAWCALRFNGSAFDVDLDTPLGAEGLPPEEEDRQRPDDEE